MKWANWRLLSGPAIRRNRRGYVFIAPQDERPRRVTLIGVSLYCTTDVTDEPANGILSFYDMNGNVGGRLASWLIRGVIRVIRVLDSLADGIRSRVGLIDVYPIRENASFLSLSILNLFFFHYVQSANSPIASSVALSFSHNVQSTNSPIASSVTSILENITPHIETPQTILSTLTSPTDLIWSNACRGHGNTRECVRRARGWRYHRWDVS